MKKVVACLALAASFVAVPAFANQQLAQQKNCLSCHSVDKKIVGPAYKDIAAKYKGKNAEAQLVQKVLKGGGGVWGPVPMPANAQVSEAEAKTLVKWVLSL